MTLRALLSLTLALVIALSSPAMAVARTSPAATGQMVLCIGTQSLTVYTDAEGRPTAAPHFCPDCALVDALLPVVPPRLAAPVSHTLLRHAGHPATAFVSAQRPTAQPRAPPLSV